MMTKKKRRLYVILINIIVMVQLLVVTLLSAFGYHIAATLVSFAILAATVIWSWESVTSIPVFAIGSTAFGFFASLPGLTLRWFSVGEAFFAGLACAIISLTNIVFFDCYYSKDRFDLN